MGPTETLAEFVRSLRFDDVPTAAIERAKETARDLIGVAVAGTEHPTGDRIIRYVESYDGGGAATMFGAGRASPPGAAVVNGTLGEALSYDDTFESMVIHPSTPVLPATLAAVETANGTGQDLLTGYLAGVETVYRVGKSTHPGHYTRGWHSTGTIGAFGAAAGAASVLGLSTAQVRHALGIAASSSSSLRKNGGSMTFALHGGHAASVGLRASLLAGDDFTADPSVFEGDLGYGTVMTPDDAFEPNELDPGRDDRWGIMDVGLKAYPCARVPQAGMDGLRELLTREGVESSAVDRVIAHFDPSLEGILDTPRPSDAGAARGSIEFCLATVLLEGDATADHFTEAFVQSRAVRDALDRVEVRYDEELGEGFSKYGARVAAVESGGTRHTVSVRDPPGSPENFLSEERQREKFLECAAGPLGQEGAAALFESLGRIDEPGKLDEVVRSLEPAHPDE